MQKLLAFKMPISDQDDRYVMQVSTDLITAAISDKARSLYLVLLSYCKANSDQCWPGQALLAEQMNCTKITIRRRLQELEQAGAIIIHAPRPPQRLHNIYQLQLQAVNYVERPFSMSESETGSKMIPIGIKNDPWNTMSESETGSKMIPHEGSKMIPESSVLNTCVCVTDNPDLSTVAEKSDITQTSDKGYVTLLCKAGLTSRATELSQLIAADRDLEWLQGWIDQPDRRGPGMIVNAIKYNWDLPPAKTPRLALQSSRNRETAEKGIQSTVCPKCSSKKLQNHKYCYHCQLELLGKKDQTE